MFIYVYIYLHSRSGYLRGSLEDQGGGGWSTLDGLLSPLPFLEAPSLLMPYEKTDYLTFPSHSQSRPISSFPENLELGLRDPSLLLIGLLCKENINSGAVRLFSPMWIGEQKQASCSPREKETDEG